MKINLNLLVGLILACLTFFEVFYFAIKLIKSIQVSKIKTQRKNLLATYASFNRSATRKTNIQTAMTANLLEKYGEKIIKDDYRNRLQTLLLNSGVVEGEGFSSLVRRKIGFSFGGFLLVFIILLLKSFTSLPFILAFILFGYFLPNLENFGNKIIGNRYKSKLENLLSSAGEWEENHYLNLVKKKIIYAFGSLLISYFYLILKNQSFGFLPFGVFLVFFGFFMPDILLQNRVLKRKEEISRGLPDAIDMLLMCVNAGLAFPAALTKVAETQSGPVAEEFYRVTKEVQLGQSRADALIAMANRTNEPRVQKFVSAMVQVDRFGIPVSSVLSEQAKEMRSARRESAREQGQKVPLKILAPIMLCFLPCVLIIILGPAVLGIIKTFSG